MINFLFVLSISLPVVGLALALFLTKKRHARFVNPLTKSLARPPGAQLGRELGTLQMEFGFDLAELLLLFVFPVTALFLVKANVITSIFGQLLLAICCAVWLGLLYLGIRKFMRKFDRVRELRLGYECELAVGQELDLLMLKGFRIFHDIPAGNFNIDHLVVGECGVFAVETKGRSKNLDQSESGKKNYRVSYEKGVLNFPGWREDEPPKQAERQAQWAAKWLSEATGFSVFVKPVVVLPGWYIENKDRPAIPVIASGYVQQYFTSQAQSVLNPQQIQQIVYQIDQKVRDISPGDIGKPLQNHS